MSLGDGNCFIWSLKDQLSYDQSFEANGQPFFASFPVEILRGMVIAHLDAVIQMDPNFFPTCSGELIGDQGGLLRDIVNWSSVA